MTDPLWIRARLELGIPDATLATLLDCSVGDLTRWRAGTESAPAAVQARLRQILNEGDLWRGAVMDRPKATRILPGGRLATWATPLLILAVLLPYAFLVFTFLLGFTFVLVPWLGGGVLLVTAIVSLRLILGLARLMGPRCSLCGEPVRRRDKICSGCQAEFTR